MLAQRGRVIRWPELCLTAAAREGSWLEEYICEEEGWHTRKLSLSRAPGVGMGLIGRPFATPFCWRNTSLIQTPSPACKSCLFFHSAQALEEFLLSTAFLLVRNKQMSCSFWGASLNVCSQFESVFCLFPRSVSDKDVLSQRGTQGRDPQFCIKFSISRFYWSAVLSSIRCCQRLALTLQFYDRLPNGSCLLPRRLRSLR